jgi:hypothetical protein
MGGGGKTLFSAAVTWYSQPGESAFRKGTS